MAWWRVGFRGVAVWVVGGGGGDCCCGEDGFDLPLTWSVARCATCYCFIAQGRIPGWPAGPGVARCRNHASQDGVCVVHASIRICEGDSACVVPVGDGASATCEVSGVGACGRASCNSLMLSPWKSHDPGWVSGQFTEIIYVILPKTES